jgi:hypothetical protein
MNWLRRLFTGKLMEAELDKELRFHFDSQVADKVRSGIAESEARRLTRHEFGGIDQIKEACRERRGTLWIESILQDVRYGLRQLGNATGFTITAVVTLALGIGANTAIVSMVDWLTLRVPSVVKPEQATTLASLESDGYSNGFSYPDFRDIRNQSSTVFSDLAASMDYQADGLSADGKSEPMWTSYVTGNFFPMMGVKPALGNLIEATTNASLDDEPVLVLGSSYWKAHFGGDPRVIGKSARVNGHPVTIICVAPKGFHGVSPLLDTQGSLPLGMAAVTTDADKDFATNRKNNSIIISPLRARSLRRLCSWRHSCPRASRSIADRFLQPTNGAEERIQIPVLFSARSRFSPGLLPECRHGDGDTWSSALLTAPVANSVDRKSSLGLGGAQAR